MGNTCGMMFLAHLNITGLKNQWTLLQYTLHILLISICFLLNLSFVSDANFSFVSSRAKIHRWRPHPFCCLLPNEIAKSSPHITSFVNSHLSVCHLRGQRVIGDKKSVFEAERGKKNRKREVN